MDITPQDNRLLVLIQERLRAAQEEEDTKFAAFRIPLDPFTPEQMNAFLSGMEGVVAETFSSHPESLYFSITAWTEGGGWAPDPEERRRLTWMHDLFKSSPMGAWMAQLFGVVDRFEDASLFEKWKYAKAWMRRETEKVLKSIVAAWNADHAAFVMSWTADLPYSLRIARGNGILLLKLVQ